MIASENLYGIVAFTFSKFLDEIGMPRDGFLISRPTSCNKNFIDGEKCRQHYNTLSRPDSISSQVKQCPYGFASKAYRSTTF